MSGGTRTDIACCPPERCQSARHTAGRAERPWRRRGMWGTSACRTRTHFIAMRTSACRTRTHYIVMRKSPWRTRTHYIVMWTSSWRTITYYIVMRTSTCRRYTLYFMGTFSCRKRTYFHEKIRLQKEDISCVIYVCREIKHYHDNICLQKKNTLFEHPPAKQEHTMLRVRLQSKGAAILRQRQTPAG